MMSENAKKPLSLPYCEYPNTTQTSLHGQQRLPEQLQPATFAEVSPYRSNEYQITVASALTHLQLLQMARGVGESFAQREPMARYLQLPTSMPYELVGKKHIDPFGTDSFGEWTYANLIYWFIRLFLLTNPSMPKPITKLNNAVLDLSYSILGENGDVIGGTYSEPLLQPNDNAQPFRSNDPFLSAVLLGLNPILELLMEQNAIGIQLLSENYSSVKQSWIQGKIIHHFMLARFEGLPKEDTAELMFGIYEQYQRQGYKYVVAEATNQWTGAALEAIGAVRVFFTPFRTQQRVKESKIPLPIDVTTPDGYVSNINSGSMFYILRLN